MKSGKKFPFAEMAILFFAAWQSRDLLNAWLHSPHDRLGWLALLVWLTPLVICQTGKPGRALSANPLVLGGAIIAGTLSELTELHFLGHVALALAFAAWVKISWRQLLWLAAAVAWMPVFGWWLANFSSGTVFAVRLLLALASAVCLWQKIIIRSEP